jgi:hypothetical protein
MASGELRSEVNRRANHKDLEHTLVLVDRFATYETAVEAIDSNLLWPDAHKEQLRAKERDALHDVAYALEIDALAAKYLKLKDEEEKELREMKQHPMPADVTGMLLSIERMSDVQTLVDLAEEQFALDYGPRLRHIVPAIESRLSALTSGSADETLKATARAVRIAWRDWREKHPSAAARLRDIRARRDRVDAEIGEAFANTRQRLGMSLR